MKIKTIQYYTDPGHGWGKVEKSLLYELNIQDKISSYSYMRGDYAYLEEDCDLTVLCQALSDKGIPVKFVEHTARIKSSKIRSYACYKPL